MNIDDLTVKQLREIQAMMPVLKAASAEKAPPFPFGPGDAVLIRTVTMIDIGRVKAVGRDWISLEDGGWVADTGRFSEMLTSGKLNEFERAPSWFVVGRGAICDAFPWLHELPKVTK
jgi:hypothetical protein